MGNDARDMTPALTTKEAAELLNVNQKTVLRLIQRGQLPARKVGRVWRLSRHALEAWLAEGPAQAKQD